MEVKEPYSLNKIQITSCLRRQNTLNELGHDIDSKNHVQYKKYLIYSRT